ncbi:MAG: DUF5063 domain-containing protein [Bacteroidaceae bacterium]|nr:DUF5063 domain-containing protein [Bacteroidaceae bacterium]
MNDIKTIVFHKNTIEFVTVAVQYCSFLEQSETMQRKDFIDVSLKLLPLLYLKASLLPPCQPLGDEVVEQFVQEDDYEVIQLTIAGILKDRNDYLDVFLSDMKYSDTPINCTISEDLTDIYQDIKNFISVYRLGLESTMYESLVVCEESFALYWGQKLVNTLRALHDAKYAFHSADEVDEKDLDDLEEEEDKCL